MTIAYFVFFHGSEHPHARISAADRDAIGDILRGTPRLLKAHLFTPTAVAGPFPDDEPPPVFALQLYFADLLELEAEIGPGGHLQALAAPGRFASLAGTTAARQAMLARPFPTPSAPSPEGPDASRCSYLVHYPGHAQDLNAWLNHYLSHHPQLMRDLPGVREIEVYTRLDWCDGMPWKRTCAMQRNKLVFDSAAALAAALTSPALRAMRADFRRFPPFAGGNVHYPMITSTIAGASGR